MLAIFDAFLDEVKTASAGADATRRNLLNFATGAIPGIVGTLGSYPLLKKKYDKDTPEHSIARGAGAAAIGSGMATMGNTAYYLLDRKKGLADRLKSFARRLKKTAADEDSGKLGLLNAVADMAPQVIGFTAAHHALKLPRFNKYNPGTKQTLQELTGNMASTLGFGGLATAAALRARNKDKQNAK